MTEELEIYAGIEGKILVYHSPYYYKHAYFYLVVRQTPKTVVVQRLRTREVREHAIGGYVDVVPIEDPPFGKQRQMLKTFKQPYLVKGCVEDDTNSLELWDGSPCTEDPMY